MTIQWGAYELVGDNGMRVGIEVTVSAVSTSSTSVTFTYKVYTENYGQYYDPQTLNFGGSYSGSSSFAFTNNEYHGAYLRTTKTYTYTYGSSSYGSSPGSVSFSATISGAYNGVTPTKSVTTSIPARPYAAPLAPSNVAAVRASDLSHTVSWTRNVTAQRPYSSLTVQRRYSSDGSTWSGWSTVATPGGTTTSVSIGGNSANLIYQYQVRANNTIGSSSYVASGNVYNTPNSPSSVTSTVNVTAVNTTWVNNHYTSANNHIEVQRSSAGGAYVQVAILAGTATSYNETPPPGVNRYRVRVYNTDSTTLYSAFVEANQVTTIVDPSTPTSVVPANAATVTKPNPQLSATLAAISSGQTQKAEWQIASNTGFTTNLVTITEPSGDLNASGVHTESPSLASVNLTNGTWYVRARAIDVYGNTSAWSGTNTFTVNTPALPTPTGVTPANGGTVTTMTPTLGLTVVSDGAGRLQRGQWQIASDSGFTQNVRTTAENETAYRASGAASVVLPSSLKLTSNIATTWYIRGRTIGNDGTYSAWAATNTFTLSMAAPPTPTLTAPVSGATISTSEPTLGATLSAASESRTSVAEWQLATDAGFTTNVKNIQEGAADLRVSGATTETIPYSNRLFQGTWYIRVRAVDQYGQAGAWSASISFTVAHPPISSPTSPSGNSTLIWNSGNKTFTFGVSDSYANDTMTAYQIVIERNDTGAVLLDTGKIFSSTKSTSIASTSPLLQDVQMRWKVRTWDQDDVVGSYSAYALFNLSAVPTVTITVPANSGSIGTGSPTVTWSLDGQTVQYSRRIVITGSGVNYDTGTVVTTSQTWTAPQTILTNGNSYSVTVYVTDTQGLTGSSTNNFTTSYQAPDEVSLLVDDTNYENGGYIALDWSGTQPDGFFVEWHVYRRVLGTSVWEQIQSYTDQYVNTYNDWLVTNGDIFEYAVTQLAGRSGEILESPIQSPAPQGNADGTHYWLINPYDETKNLKVTGVKSDSFTDEYQEAELIIIGRGRKKNQGTRFGYSGELQAQFRDDLTMTARQKREALQAIKDAQVTCYLRTPFGDLFQIGVGNLSFSRVAGTGTNEFVDVTVPYGEVF